MAEQGPVLFVAAYIQECDLTTERIRRVQANVVANRYEAEQYVAGLLGMM